MDYLKKNWYWICLGIAGAGLIALAWFFVISPTVVSSAEDTLAQEVRRVDQYLKGDMIPTARLETQLETNVKNVRDDRDRGIDYYNKRLKRFNEYFDGQEEPPPVGSFAARYTQEMDRLIQAYRDENEIAVAEDADEADAKTLRPVVDVQPPGSITPVNMQTTMHEYWVTRSIFESVNDLKLKGLQEIRFDRSEDGGDESPAEEFAALKTDVKISMPLARVDELVADLMNDDEVMFLFYGFESQKGAIPAEFMELVKVVEHEGPPGGLEHAELIQDAPVTITLDLRVFLWKARDAVDPLEELEVGLEDDEEDDPDDEEE